MRILICFLFIPFIAFSQVDTVSCIPDYNKHSTTIKTSTVNPLYKGYDDIVRNSEALKVSFYENHYISNTDYIVQSFIPDSVQYWIYVIGGCIRIEPLVISW